MQPYKIQLYTFRVQGLAFFLPWFPDHLQNGEANLSSTDAGKSCQNREFSTRQICLLMLFAKTKFSRKFPNLQYLTTVDISVDIAHHEIVRAKVGNGKGCLKCVNQFKPSVLFVGHRQTGDTQSRRRTRCMIRVSNVCLQNVLSKFE